MIQMGLLKIWMDFAHDQDGSILSLDGSIDALDVFICDLGFEPIQRLDGWSKYIELYVVLVNPLRYIYMYHNPFLAVSALSIGETLFYPSFNEYFFM